MQSNLTAIHELLLERGYHAEVINLTRYRQTPNGRIHYPASTAALLVLLLRLRPHILHLHIGGGIPIRLLLLALVCTLLPGRRTVLTLHSGGYPDSPAGRSARPDTLRGFVFRRFDRIIAVNAQLVALFLRFGVEPSRVRQIAPHALASRLPDVDIPAGIEEFFGSHEPVLLSMGWLEPEYDFPLQIEALGAVRARFPRAGLLILGSGRLESALHQQVRENGHQGHVYLPGDQPHDVALRCIARAHVFLRTTWYDGDSVSVREALHWGTPVVASDNGMRPPGVVLIPPRDAQALAAGIEAAFTAPPPRPAGEGEGRRNIEAVLQLYSELL